MAQYSVKKSRGRKIKKYRKSRRGKGRGKRSLKGGKTRRYKVFKNTKNHTLGKRKGRGRGRRMMRGGEETDWRSSTNQLVKLQEYINYKYSTEFDSLLEASTDDYTSNRPSYAIITNLSKFFKQENQFQYVLMFTCQMNKSTSCYALVRCPEVLHENPNGDTHLPPIIGMNPKILFISPTQSDVVKVEDDSADTESAFDRYQNEMLTSYKKMLERHNHESKANLALKLSDIQKKYAGTGHEGDQIAIAKQTAKDALNLKIREVNTNIEQQRQFDIGQFKQMFKCYKFTNRISSKDDKYRIFVKGGELGILFDTILASQKRLPPEETNLTSEDHEESEQKRLPPEETNLTPEDHKESEQTLWGQVSATYKLTKDMLESDHDKVIKFINEKYKKKFVENGIRKEGFTHLQLNNVKSGERIKDVKIDYVKVLLKNTSNFGNKYKKYFLYVFGCFDDDVGHDPACYALVIVDVKGNVNELFIFKHKSEVKNTPCPDSENFPTDCANLVSGSSCFTFKSFISSYGDNYSLVMPNANSDYSQREFNTMFKEIF